MMNGSHHVPFTYITAYYAQFMDSLAFNDIINIYIHID